MEKLLHERLREHEGISDDFFVVGEEDGILLSKDEAQAIADEIERYYIARPRFEDGEPVHFGDSTEELHHVDTISFYESGDVSLNSVDDEVFLGLGGLAKR